MPLWLQIVAPLALLVTGAAWLVRALAKEELMRQIRPSPNPLPAEDIERLRIYIDRLRRGEWLTPPEARDFYRISDVVTREYPNLEGSWVLFVAAGIVLGLMLAESKP